MLSHLQKAFSGYFHLLLQVLLCPWLQRGDTQESAISHLVVPYLASDILDLIQPDLKIPGKFPGRHPTSGKSPKHAQQHCGAAPSLQP